MEQNGTVRKEDGLPDVSLVIPIYNEEGSIHLLLEAIQKSCDPMGYTYEVIAVNDGSRDDSLKQLLSQREKDPRIKIINFSRNYGQTAALAAGFDHSRADIVVTLDADLQNDPRDIPELLAKLKEGYDVVSGWRKDRKDAFISRTVPSKLANILISKITGVHLHDYGCTLKVYRRQFLQTVKFYGEMHRFIPAYLAWHGAKVVEMPVQHHPRRFGTTKYGITRVFRVILDLFTVKYLTKYRANPMHFFGKFGFLSFFLSIVVGLFAFYLKFVEGTSFISTPLPILVVFLFLLSFQFVLMGLLAETLTRIYFESQNKPIYEVKDTYY